MPIFPSIDDITIEITGTLENILLSSILYCYRIRNIERICNIRGFTNAFLKNSTTKTLTNGWIERLNNSLYGTNGYPNQAIFSSLK